jgi:hypothetical protein
VHKFVLTADSETMGQSFASSQWDPNKIRSDGLARGEVFCWDPPLFALLGRCLEFADVFDDEAMNSGERCMK